MNLRIKQVFFRNVVLASYGFRCCVTGLAIQDLLNASHIVPWSVDRKNRLNPHNGLALNALHDRAFDRGYITILPAGEMRVARNAIKEWIQDEAIKSLLLRYEGVIIAKAERFPPNQDFLEYHNDHLFRRR